ncbi:MAG: GNAT family N-acetyltransferase [Bacilli bacterium]|nr:GNAT family N-acetyltransferase [Bacilli bacterium]
MEIKHYKASELLLLRRNVMRPNMESFEDVIYDKDDHPSAIHLGVENDGKIIACVSAYQENNPDLSQQIQYRIRALCVDENYRLQGIARMLFNKIIEEVTNKGAQAIWFTARTHLTKFYNSFGFKEYGEEFLVPNSCMHIKMYKSLI